MGYMVPSSESSGNKTATFLWDLSLDNLHEILVSSVVFACTRKSGVKTQSMSEFSYSSFISILSVWPKAFSWCFLQIQVHKLSFSLAYSDTNKSQSNSCFNDFECSLPGATYINCKSLHVSIALPTPVIPDWGEITFSHPPNGCSLPSFHLTRLQSDHLPFDWYGVVFLNTPAGGWKGTNLPISFPHFYYITPVSWNPVSH